MGVRVKTVVNTVICKFPKVQKTLTCKFPKVQKTLSPLQVPKCPENIQSLASSQKSRTPFIYHNTGFGDKTEKSPGLPFIYHNTGFSDKTEKSPELCLFIITPVLVAKQKKVQHSTYCHTCVSTQVRYRRAVTCLFVHLSVRQQLTCERNSSYSFLPIVLKLHRCFGHSV